jgi:ppGpp synthetase/RelA/SpoT-type nucleotidyltranferase
MMIRNTNKYKRKRTYCDCSHDDDDKNISPVNSHVKSPSSTTKAAATFIIMLAAFLSSTCSNTTSTVYAFHNYNHHHHQQQQQQQRRSTIRHTSYNNNFFLVVLSATGDDNGQLDHVGSTTLIVHPKKHKKLSPSSSSVLQLPPWLQRYQTMKPEQVQTDTEWLEVALLEHHQFTASDVSDIIKAIYVACHGDVPKIIGCISFCKLLLQLEDQDSTATRKPTNYLVSKDVILASILHYSECVSARYEGLYEQVQNVDTNNDKRETSLLSSSSSSSSSSSLYQLAGVDMDDNEQPGRGDDANNNTNANRILSLRARLSNINDDKNNNNDNEKALGIFTADSLRLARSASQIKRAEILATVISSDNRPFHKRSYDDIRDLLVSLSDDWRALAIRCVASLYRLEGVVDVTVGTGREYLKDATLTARDSLRIYSPLAERMGLHRLKAQLEALGFQVSYPRQYSAASTLFRQHGDAMEAISSFLSNKLKQLLYEDPSLMYELEDLQVVSRVKEPYSFWKKLLKKRLAPANVESTTKSQDLVRPSQALSVLEVNDGVAMRVILKARKLDTDESDETTRSRERMLCYYVQRLVRSQWPEVDSSRVKDYIRSPKPNGYQSLHHTSKITRNGQEFFFEIQIRSNEMHQLAEFGVAAHWTYKLDGKLPMLPSSSSSITLYPTHNKDLPVQLDDDDEKEDTVVDVVDDASTNEDMANTASIGIAEAESASYIHALQEARRNLMQSHVYIFLAESSSSLESGQLLTLEAGSLIADVVGSLCDSEGLNCSDEELQVWKNGKLALLNEPIRNGDMLLVEPVGKTNRRKKTTTVR